MASFARGAVRTGPGCRWAGPAELRTPRTAGCGPGRPERCGLPEVVPVELHDLNPGGNEVLDELLLRVVGRVDLDDAAQDRVGSEDQVGRRGGADHVAVTVQPLVDTLGVG